MDLGRGLFQVFAKEEMSAIYEVSVQPRCEPMQNKTQPQVSHMNGEGIDQEASSQRRDDKRDEVNEINVTHSRKYEWEELEGHGCWRVEANKENEQMV